MTSRAENLAVVRKWGDAYDREGPEVIDRIIDQVFDPEIEFSPLLAREIEGRSYHGHDGVRQFFGELNEALGEVRYAKPQYEAVSDDFIVLLTTLIGTGRGSSVAIEQELGMVYEFANGRVIRLTAYGSHDEARAAARQAAGAEA